MVNSDVLTFNLIWTQISSYSPRFEVNPFLQSRFWGKYLSFPLCERSEKGKARNYRNWLGALHQKGVKQQKSQSTVPTVTELLQLEGISAACWVQALPFQKQVSRSRLLRATSSHVLSVTKDEESLCHLSQPVPTFDKCHVLVSPELEPAPQMCPTMGLRREDGLPPPHLLVGLFLR